MKKHSENLDNLQQKLYLPAMVVSLIAIILVAIMPTLGQVGIANPKNAEGFGLWLNFLGQFHPLFLHLPIGALMLVFMLEGARVLTRNRYRPNTTLGLAFTAATGVFAVVFGYCLYLTDGYQGKLIEAHKRDGIIFSIFALLTFMVKYTADVKPQLKASAPVYYLGLAVTGFVMITAGHYGGEISHGDPLAQLPSTILEARNAVDLDPVVYTSIVHPILENKCISCHGEDKQKGGLRMDSMAALLEGGEEGDCLVPGDLKKSKMVSFLHLPAADDLHMPPAEKTQLTPEEVKIIEWWVAMGAPESKRRSEVNVTPEIEAALATLLTPAEREKREQAKRDAELAEKNASEAKRKQLASALESVNKRFPGSLKYISQTGTDLSFNVVSYRDQFKDEDLELLSGAAGDITEMNLGSAKISDKGVQLLDRFVNLKILKLSETGASDASLATLVKLPALEALNLYGTEVTDGGLKSLYQSKSLLRVYLWNSKVTAAGAKALEEALRKQYAETQAKLSEEDRHGKQVTQPEVLLGAEG